MKFKCKTTYRLLAATEEVWIRYRIAEIGSLDVGSQTFRWFVGHLDTVLQDRNREVVGRVTGQPQAEVRMDGVRIQRFLEENANKTHFSY